MALYLRGERWQSFRPHETFGRCFPGLGKSVKPALSPYGFIPTDSSDLLRRATGGLPGSSPTPAISPRLSVSFFSLSRPSHSRSSSLQRHNVRQLQLGLDQAQKGHSGDGEKPLAIASAACRCCRARLSYSVAPPGDALPSYCGSTCRIFRW